MKLKIWLWLVTAGICFAAEPLKAKTIYLPEGNAKILQLVVDLASPGDEVVVPPGVYDFDGRKVAGQRGTLTRLVVDKPLTIRSAAGPEATFLVGGPSMRCLYLTNGAEVIGFTISGGETSDVNLEGNKFADLSGGGVWSEPGGTITDCVVVSNTALWYGGGLYGGNAIRCEFKENTARRSGGAASHARLGSCLLAYNRAGRYGGGAQRSELFNCTVAQNQAEVMGGGTAFGAAQNTAIHHNQTLLGNHNYFKTEMTYSSSWPKPKGKGNLDGDPGFKSTDTGIFSLRDSSPLIDQGTHTFLTADLKGLPRALDGNNNQQVRVDIGAFEFVLAEVFSDKSGVPELSEPVQ